MKDVVQTQVGSLSWRGQMVDLRQTFVILAFLHINIPVHRNWKLKKMLLHQNGVANDTGRRAESRNENFRSEYLIMSTF